MAGERVVIANYSTLLPDSVDMKRLEAAIDKLLVIRDPTLITLNDGWLPMAYVSQKWPDVCGLVLLDPDAPWQGSPQDPKESPVNYFTGRSRTAAGWPLRTVTITTASAGTWVDDAVQAVEQMQKVLASGTLPMPTLVGSARPSALDRSLLTSAREFAGNVLIDAGNDLVNLGYSVKGTVPPLGWGP
jgi:hypothetical protein